MVQPTPLTLAAAVIFLNERELLPRMLASIERQLRTPELLLLVDDGSSDGSHEIATNFAAAHPYARVVRGLERERTSDRLARAHELIAFQAALEQLDREQARFDVYAKLDADLELPPDYLARIMATLESEAAGRDRRLPAEHARSGGWKGQGGALATLACARRDQVLPPRVPGADLTPAAVSRLGHDRRDAGAATRLPSCSVDFPEQPPLHLRPTGSYDGVLRGYRRRGAAAWGYGAHPLHVAASVALRMRDRPRVLAGLAYLGGYFDAGLRRASRVEPETRRYLQREQLARLRGALPLRAARQGRETNQMKLEVENGAALALARPGA